MIRRIMIRIANVLNFYHVNLGGARREEEERILWCERAAGNKVRILALVLGQPSIAWALPVPEGKFQLVQEAQPIETILEAKGPPLFLQANCSVDGGREGRSHGCD